MWYSFSSPAITVCKVLGTDSLWEPTFKFDIQRSIGWGHSQKSKQVSQARAVRKKALSSFLQCLENVLVLNVVRNIAKELYKSIAFDRKVMVMVDVSVCWCALQWWKGHKLCWCDGTVTLKQSSCNYITVQMSCWAYHELWWIIVVPPVTDVVRHSFII